MLYIDQLLFLNYHNDSNCFKEITVKYVVYCHNTAISEGTFSCSQNVLSGWQYYISKYISKIANLLINMVSEYALR